MALALATRDANAELTVVSVPICPTLSWKKAAKKSCVMGP
jgi:hypothetical protein